MYNRVPATDRTTEPRKGPRVSDSVIDQEARRQITQLSHEQGKITATLEALSQRIDREGKATARAMESQTRALETIVKRLNNAQTAMAFTDGQNVTRWTLLGAAIVSFFAFVGGLSTWLLQRIFG